MTQPKRAWMVRAGNDNELAEDVENRRAVAIGWSEMGDLSGLSTRTDFKQRYRDVYNTHSDNRMAVNAGQIFRFVCKFEQGDYVLTYIKSSRDLLIGHVDGAYEYDPTLFSESYPNVRRVEWLQRISRDEFSKPARNSMGSSLTVFSLDEHIDEIHTAVTSPETVDKVAEEEEEESPPFFQELKAQVDELIADQISQLDPYDFQDLVAAVLRAMGFQAVSSPPGPDRGVDIVAHPDPFGFDKPRIKVQVKHRQDSAGGPDVLSFLGTLRDGESGLFVSTGGFTRHAHLEAEQSGHPVKLYDRDNFIELLLEHYNDLESEYKAQVPLRRIWVPAE